MENNQAWNDYVVEISKFIENKEKHQRRIGQIAFEIYTERGKEGFAQLSNDVENMTGFKLSFNSLRVYKWVYSKIKDLDVPQDIPFHAIQTIVGADNPEKYIEDIKQGIPYGEVIKQIKEAKGVKHRIHTCPACGHSFE